MSSSTWNTADVVPKESKTVLQTDITSIKEETGIDRVKRMYQANEFGELGPEANIILQAGSMSIFVGAIYGGILSSRAAYMNFIENNQATIFKDHLDAKKKLQDKVTTSFAKGAFKWGWRLAAFSTSYVGLSTTISVYRGKSGIVEHLVAGTCTGFLYKFTGGPRAWIVGGGLGMALGAIAGCCTYGLLSLTGMSMEEVRYWNYRWRESRSEHMKEAIAKHVAEEQNALFRERNEQSETKHNMSLNSIPEEDIKH